MDMTESKRYVPTIRACFVGFIVQAIVNNFAPLLFLTFSNTYHIPLSQITLLITVNFGLQLATDALSALFIDRIGYRRSAVLAHGLAATGLVLMAILPSLLPSPFPGLLLSAAIYAVGGGLLEVLMSPVVEHCPTPNKQSAMGLLHSFYCWGQMGVVLVSTLFFVIFGIRNWRVLAIFWALIPAANAYLFTKVPMPENPVEGASLSIRTLIKNRLFLLFFLLMLCAGACELAMSQWASAFAEKGLGVSKTLGDLMGPMLFALTQALGRTIYGKRGHRYDLTLLMLASGGACILCYLLAAFSPWPALGLLGCACCGFTVAILWPGTFSLASARIPAGGTAMFALLALAGDLGCTSGPTLVGAVSGLFDGRMQTGLLFAVFFPALLILCVLLLRRHDAAAAPRKVH